MSGNPYHDAEGRFCSANQMLTSINALAQAGEVEAFMKLRDEYEAIRRDIRFGRTEVGPEHFDRELKAFVHPAEPHPRYPLPDAKALPFNRVRRGLNKPGEVNQHLAQLDNEARELRVAVDKAAIGTLDFYGGMGSSTPNIYLRQGDDGLRTYLRRHGAPEAEVEEDLESYRSMAQRMIAGFDHIFAEHPRAERNLRNLHRVITVPENVEPAEFVAANYPVGAEITEPAYLSTSVDSDTVLLHSEGSEARSVVFEILTREGIPVHRTDGSGGAPGRWEREVLLNRGGRYKVVAHGEATYASTHLDGRPKASRHTRAKARHRYTVVQLVQVTD